MQTVLVVFAHVLRYPSLRVLLPPQCNGGECHFVQQRFLETVSLLLAAKHFNWDYFLMKK